MDDLYAVFHLAKEAIISPNNLSLRIAPCPPGKANFPSEDREEFFLGDEAEYPPNTEWVVSVDSDGEEEFYAAGPSPREAVSALVGKLKEKVSKRRDRLETVLDEADCPHDV